MKDGFVKIACATPELKVADCDFNTDKMIELIQNACDRGVKIICFPELSITGYTCGDLFLQNALIRSAAENLIRLTETIKNLDIVAIVGLPVEYQNKLYNCAAVVFHGEILGLVPKTHIPNYGEFYEMRHFTSAPSESFTMNFGNYTPLFGTAQTFRFNWLTDIEFGIEICEDLWTADTPSVKLAQNGANLIFNLSASDEIIGKADYRRTIIKAKSSSLLCAYAYADAGVGESTQDMTFAGHNIIAENGSVLAESKLFESGLTVADIDVSRLASEKRRMNTFKSGFNEEFYVHGIDMPTEETKLERYISPLPFVPSDRVVLDGRCEEILKIQAVGLATRLKHIGCKNAVVGLSGGLDSTLALIVMTHAFDMLGLDRSGILTITMPCFGTTDRTYTNACRLAEAYGATLKEIDIKASVRQHFQDIGQDEANHDVVYENSQARERTQILMDMAYQCNGIVIGTGDLSELALGWATYNGDHISMYAVNASVPKTLVRYLVAYEAGHTETSLSAVLKDILDTPVSPELLPPDETGNIAQKTEDLVGPYELHDFFLYYMLRFGFMPSKIFRMAKHAFAGKYSDEIILKWQKKFYWRFFSQHFKRSCLPDAPKVGSVTLSPRGDFRMPSDACANIWLRELEKMQI
ncbi:MAG: NAD(+) synthase [Oscillospiraceae bacterium]|nr:NAD(+) synthase [Oscillospiraceae bacterium]